MYKTHPVGQVPEEVDVPRLRKVLPEPLLALRHELAVRTGQQLPLFIHHRVDGLFPHLLLLVGEGVDLAAGRLVVGALGGRGRGLAVGAGGRGLAAGAEGGGGGAGAEAVVAGQGRGHGVFCLDDDRARDI